VDVTVTPAVAEEEERLGCDEKLSGAVEAKEEEGRKLWDWELLGPLGTQFIRPPPSPAEFSN
jgi:hypothetical protein